MRLRRRRRGITLLETMVTAAVLILGIGAVASTVVAIVRLNRRNLAQAQAYTVAEWWLERVTRVGCDAFLNPENPCGALTDLDGDTFTVYWNASGAPTLTEPPPSDKEARRPYRVSIDVDPPTEGDEEGDPPYSRIAINDADPLKRVELSQTLNVRVTVSWKDELSRNAHHAVALQTRVSP